jgi:tetratricopeptide (TPR) repeat protein
MGSDSLDSFIRLSLPSGPALYRPYYSGTATVTYTGLNSPVVLGPAPAQAAGAAVGYYRFKQDPADEVEYLIAGKTGVDAARATVAPSAPAARGPYPDLGRPFGRAGLAEEAKGPEPEWKNDTSEPSPQDDQPQRPFKQEPALDAERSLEIEDFDQLAGEPEMSEELARLVEEASSSRAAEDSDVKEGASVQDKSPSQAEISMKARAILGEHESIDSFSRERFIEHINRAESFMAANRYYLAADAYAIAASYDPGNPLPRLGKSHALLAAGEFMSSALFLARAIELAGKDAASVLDSGAAMNIERDKLESRAIELSALREKGGSGEIEFLLAYLYHRLGRDQAARSAIGAALEKLPESGYVSQLAQILGM